MIVEAEEGEESISNALFNTANRLESDSSSITTNIIKHSYQEKTDQHIRLNYSMVVAIDMPEGISSGKVRKIMADQFLVEISGAFGLNIIRIGQMGEQCRSHNLFKTLYAMGIAFRQEGFSINLSEGMAAMEKRLTENPDRFVT